MIQLISSVDNTREKPYLPTQSRKVIDSRKMLCIHCVLHFGVPCWHRKS